LNRLNKYILFFIFFTAGYLFAQQEDSLTINYNYINTFPQNANIFLNDVLIGHSPLYFMWDSTAVYRKITIKHDGFAVIDYTPAVDEVSINRFFNMVPLSGYNEKEIVFKDKSFAFQKPFKIVPIIISTALTAGSAIMAYYFKSLAIQKSDDYNITGDPALLDKKKKYDLIGGISLAVFQAGLCALIYFHFIE